MGISFLFLFSMVSWWWIYNRKKTRFLLNFAGALFLIFQGTNALGEGPYFSHLTVENGLSANNVKSIIQDADGFMWFGTLEGLDRYDGTEIRSYNGNFPTAPHNVRSLLIDRSDNFWVGTAEGLYVRKKQSADFEKIYADSTGFQSLCQLTNGDVLAGTGQGILIVGADSLHVSKTYFKPSNPFDRLNHITSIAQLTNKKVFVGTMGGVVEWNPQKKINKVFSIPNSKSANSISSLLLVDHHLLVGTYSQGIYRLGLTDNQITTIKGLNNHFVLCMTKGTNGKIYVGTDGGGINVLDSASLKVNNYILHDPDDLHSIGSNSVYSIFVSPRGRIWAGTYSAGVSQAQQQNQVFKTYEFPEQTEVASPSIRSFCFPNDHTRLLGTRDGFYQVDENSHHVTYFNASGPSARGLTANIILSIFQNEGKIYVGTYGGGARLFDLRKHEFEPFINDPEFDKGCIYDFKRDKRGEIWIATLDGLYRYSPNKSKSLNLFDAKKLGIPTSKIFSLYIDSLQRMWVGTMQGLFLFQLKNGEPVSIQFPNSSLNGYKVNYVYEDEKKNIWVCTETGGLFRISNDLSSTKRFTDDNGLPCNSICSIIQGNNGNFWIGTLKGFCRMNHETHQFDHYGLSDGIPGLVFTPAAVMGKLNHQIWFGTENGMFSFYPDSISAAVPPPVSITDFYLFGNRIEPGTVDFLKAPVEETSRIVLKQRQSSIGFRFVAMNYNAPTETKFVYMLKGHDKGWQYAGTNQTVFYEKLRPGEYVFKVKAAGDIKNISMRQIHVIIKPSLFTHPLFIGFWFLVIIFIIWRLDKRFRKQKDEIIRLEEETKPKEKYLSSKMDVSQGEKIQLQLVEYFKNETPYLNADIKLSDVAAHLGCSNHQLSQAINQFLGKNFTDFVNHYRVEEVKRRMKSPDRDKYTLMALAEQCGFNSKASFYRSFKKETGLTPAEYLKQLDS